MKTEIDGAASKGRFVRRAAVRYVGGAGEPDRKRRTTAPSPKLRVLQTEPKVLYQSNKAGRPKQEVDPIGFVWHELSWWARTLV